MYESFFGFSARPFAAAPLARRYFPAATIESARQTLARCIERAEGVGLLIGPAGNGKTLLCQVLAEQFRGSLEVAMLASGRLSTRRALLQSILFELGMPYRGIEESDLRLMLVDRLSKPAKTTSSASSAEAQTAGLLLIVDEAHTLPVRLLEELRLITNLAQGGQSRVRLILSGGPQLEERFASPKLEAFNQRVAARCYLESLDRRQTVDYVRHQIQQVGGQPDGVFSPDAKQAVYTATDGIPRLVNQVCDHALLLAYAGGVRQLTAAGIEEAWADLQQLPTPRNSDSPSAASESAGSVVEFGSLDDDESANELSDELPSAVPFRNFSTEPKPSTESPAQRLREITAKLAEIDDDFQPAGSIGPEVELTIPAAPNPFDDAFEEEEVVIDRYTTPQTDALANRPLVRSAESRELGAMLSHAQRRISATKSTEPAVNLHQPSVAETELEAMDRAESANDFWPGGVPDAQPLPIAELPAAPIPYTDSPIVETAFVAPPAAPKAPVAPAAQSKPNPQPDATRVTHDSHNSVLPKLSDPQALLIKKYASTVWPAQATETTSSPAEKPVAPAALSTTAIAAEAENDADLIVIEDMPEATVVISKKPTPLVRRKEYRQLFAQLRRGS